MLAFTDAAPRDGGTHWANSKLMGQVQDLLTICLVNCIYYFESFMLLSHIDFVVLVVMFVSLVYILFGQSPFHS